MKALAPQAFPIAPAAPDRNGPALREAARQFESVFAQMMLSSMRSTSFGDDLMGDGGLYRDLYDAEMAKALSSGRGLGIAELMVRQLRDQADGVPAAQGLRLPPRTAPVSGPVATDSPEAFIESVRPHAEQAASALGVPVEFVLAQAALESGWGRQPAGGGHNLFGIKADASWRGAAASHGTHEYVDGARRAETASFRRYDSAAQSFSDYVQFLRDNPRYREALDHGGDGATFARRLQDAGYATDPQYAEKIIKLAGSRPIQSASDRGAS